MFLTDHERIASMARKKVEYLRGSLFGFVIASALAGVYLGFGVALIFSLGAPLAAAGAPVVKLVMGMAFGIALTLVIFAGSELFTGNNLVGAVGGLSRSISWADVGLINFWSWFGNLIGSLGIAFLIVQSGVIAKAPQSDFLVKAAAIKMTLPAWELFIRGILCNWLICLAVWMTGRTTNDAAKIVLIFWCLFAFIATGFEHSIANQSLLGMALLLPHDAVVSWGGFWYNQFFVVLGNIVGGGLFVGGLYWLASPYRVAGVCADNASRPISAPAVQQG